MKRARWGDVCQLRYGKALRGYSEESSDEHRFRVFGTNGPIGWTAEPLCPHAGIVIGRKGAYRGVHFSPEPFFVIDTAFYLELKTDEIDLRWAYYRLLTVDINAMDVGAAIPTTNRDQFHALALTYPVLSVQRSAVALLSSFDDLIDHNSRRIKLLEGSVRLLFDEWFVRHRFPGSTLATQGSDLPSGWYRQPLGQLTTKIGSGATPRGGDASYVEDGIALIRSQNVYDYNFVEDGLARINDDQAALLSSVSIEAEDVLLNITGASVARCCMVPRRLVPARVNQHVMIIRADRDKIDPYYLLFAINSDERKRQLLSYAQTGSTREALTKDLMSNFEIVVPDESNMRAFAELAGDVFQQREVLAEQNIKLHTARDLLLPRLMSGELTV